MCQSTIVDNNKSLMVLYIQIKYICIKTPCIVYYSTVCVQDSTTTHDSHERGILSEEIRTLTHQRSPVNTRFIVLSVVLSVVLSDEADSVYSY